MKMQILGGSSILNDSYIGSEREITIDTTNYGLRIHDGSTSGGHSVGSASRPAAYGIESTIASSTSLTISADSAIVGVSTSGHKTALPSFSLSLNLSTTGAGGVLSAITSGFLAVYIIYNPDNSSSALFGIDCSSSAPAVCVTASSLPSGYTQSCLISIIPVSSGSFTACYVKGNEVSFSAKTIISSVSAVSSWTSVSLASYVPPGAKRVFGLCDVSSSTSTDVMHCGVAIDSSGTGQQSTNGIYTIRVSFNIAIKTSQTIYSRGYNDNSGATTRSLFVTGYTI